MDLSQNEYECPGCGGSLIRKTARMVHIMEACKRCGGTGKVDWVANVVESTSNKTNFEAERGAAMSNINMLRTLMIEEGARVGVHINISLEFQNINDYLTKVAPPMLIKGGKINVPY